MSRNYKFHNPDGVYFVSFAVIEWLDVFTRNDYKDIVVDSLRYCQQEKGMEIFAWPRGLGVTNHVHLIFRSSGKQKPELLLGDLKRFTSKAIVKAIIDNPVEEGFVFRPEDYLYSSAADYAGEKGILDDVIVVK